MMEQAGEH